MKTHILVTGGAGYIGSHTCKALAQKGYTPVTFDNFSNGHRHAVKYGPCIEGDLQNTCDIKQALDDYECKAVLHFAGAIEVGESTRNPQKYYANNIAGSLNLLSAMMDAGIKNIVFSSSCAVYGQPTALPICEDTSRVPINPYGFTKYAIEKALEDFHNAHNLNYFICRYFNACGADPDGELGEEHSPETHIIPLLLRAALDPSGSFSIFGDDYDTNDGTCIRDYIHVSDLANAHILALEHLLKGNESMAINLGSGRGYSVKEIANSVQELTGQDIKVHIEKRRLGDPAILLADTERAKRVLKFETEHSDLDTILKTALNFYKAS